MEGGRIPVVGAIGVRCEREPDQDCESLSPAPTGTLSKRAGPERPLALPIPALNRPGFEALAGKRDAGTRENCELQPSRWLS